MRWNFVSRNDAEVSFLVWGLRDMSMGAWASHLRLCTTALVVGNMSAQICCNGSKPLPKGGGFFGARKSENVHYGQDGLRKVS